MQACIGISEEECWLTLVGHGRTVFLIKIGLTSSCLMVQYQHGLQPSDDHPGFETSPYSIRAVSEGGFFLPLLSSHHDAMYRLCGDLHLQCTPVGRNDKPRFEHDRETEGTKRLAQPCACLIKFSCKWYLSSGIVRSGRKVETPNMSQYLQNLRESHTSPSGK